MNPRATIEVTHGDIKYRVELDMSSYSQVYSIDEVIADLVWEKVADDYEGDKHELDRSEFPIVVDGFEAWQVVSTEDMPKNTRTTDDMENVFAAYFGSADDITYMAYVEWCNALGAVQSPDDFTERLCGSFDNEGDYAESVLNDAIGLHRDEYEIIRGYIDYEAMERDMVLGGDIMCVEANGRRYILSNH